MFLNAVNSEQLMIDTYDVRLNVNFDAAKELEEDKVSRDILSVFHPILLNSVYPALVAADGNCLYRAVSLGLCGNQNQHHLIRLLAALEIAQHRIYYDIDSKDYIDIIKCGEIVVAQYKNILRAVCDTGEWADISHLYAVSAVLEFAINSYCPPIMDEHFMVRPLTRRICGRNIKNQNAEMTIMWSQTTVPDKQEDFVPNHFVLLREYKAAHMKSTETEITDLTVGPIVIPNHSTPAKAIEDSATENVLNRSEKLNTSVPEDGEITSSLEKVSTISYAEPNITDIHANDSDNCVSYASSSSPSLHVSQLKEPIAVGGTELPGGKLLCVDELVRQISITENALGEVPCGVKEDVFFAVNNSNNVDRKNNGQRSEFWDDCGAWCTDSHSPITLYHVSENGKLGQVVLRENLVCVKKRHNKKYII